MLRYALLFSFLSTPLVTLGCGDDTGGACGVCDQAEEAACQTRCEDVCDICADVDPASVESVECFGDTLNVFLDDNSTVACNG